MHAIQTGPLVAGNEIGRAHVGGQHGLFNDSMCFVPDPRDDFFNPPGFVANNLGFSGFKIHRSPSLTGLQQSTEHILQVQQMRHQWLALRGFRSTRVAQDRGHLGVCQPRVAEHHSGVELISVNLPPCSYQHVTNHAQAFDLGVERTQPV